MTRRFCIGDRVTVRDATSMFHTRTQAFTRGRTGTVVEFRPDWYFIGLDQGATSVFGQNTDIHEFVHDARHLLGFPCH